jgi:hypothetical protein
MKYVVKMEQVPEARPTSEESPYSLLVSMALLLGTSCCGWDSDGGQSITACSVGGCFRFIAASMRLVIQSSRFGGAGRLPYLPAVLMRY